MEEIEETLGSKGRIKVLAALMRARNLVSVSKLKAETRLKRRNVEKHLYKLAKLGWVETVEAFGHRRYRL